MGGAGVYPHLSSGTCSHLYRLALSLRSAHGCRIIVHHGFLRESFVSQPLNLIVFILRQIIMFSDLECDYINPIDLCNKLNQVRPSLFTFVYPPNVRWRTLACLGLSLSFLKTLLMPF